MSFITDLLVNEGIALANPLIISEEELQLQKLFVADAASFKLVCEAVETLTSKLAPHVSATTLGGKVILALISDLQTGVTESAKINGVTL